MEMLHFLILFFLFLATILFITYKKDMRTQRKHEENKTTSNSQFMIHRISERIFVLIDKSTHVQYLQVYRNNSLGNGGGNSLTPLYKANGELCVGEDIKPNRFLLNELDDLMGIITDSETQVQYLQVYRNKLCDGGVALIPLLNAEGKLKTK